MDTDRAIVVMQPAANAKRGILSKLAGMPEVAVWECANAAELYRLIQRVSGGAGAHVVVVLGGSLRDNCSIATYLRVFRPRVGIIGLTDTTNEAQAVSLLHSGADNYCSNIASATLMSAIVFGLLRRLGSADAPSGGTVDPVDADVWRLCQQGWTLIDPSGRSMALTTGERAFMVALTNAPQACANHTELLAAVNASYASNRNSNSKSRAVARLGVLVSRMRNKFSQQGVALPLKSVHNRGYMFTGQFHIEAVGIATHAGSVESTSHRLEWPLDARR